jgi:hypothetical protein
MGMSGSGVEKNALNASANAGRQADTAYNTVDPIYSEMASGNVGLTPIQKSRMLTASGQSLGGANAGAVGQGALYAARTGNAGAATAAIDDSARSAMEKQSENAVDVENKDAQLASQNQRFGLSGISDIYSDANRTGEGYLGTANSASQAKRNSIYGLIDPITSILGSNKRVQGIGS